MGLFSGIKDQESSKRGNYITVGDYDLKLITLAARQSRQDKAKNFVIAEYEVVRFTPTSKFTERKVKTGSGVGIETIEAPVHEPGVRLTHYIDFSRRVDMAQAKVKDIIVCLVGGDAAVNELIAEEMKENGIDEDAAWEKLAEEATGPDNPFAGELVSCEAVDIRTKDDMPFTVINYRAHEKAA